MLPLKVLRNLITGRSLFYVHHGITHRCPFRCRMCTVWKTADKATEIATDRYAEVAGKLARLGCVAISLGGGEPFVRSDLPDIVSSFVAAGIRTRVLTNGATPAVEDFERVFSAGLRDVSVSLDTLNPQLQADIYDGQDVWPRIRENLEWLSRAVKERNLFVLLNTVVSGLNLDDLADLVEFAAGHGFHISFVPLELAGSADEDNPFAAFAPDMAITEDKWPALVKSFQELIRMKRGGYPIFNSTAFLTMCCEYLRGRTMKWPCRAGQLFLSIDPTGAASFCHQAEAFASVIDSDFEERYRSVDVQKEATRYRRDCTDCLRPCWVEPTLGIHHRPSAWEQFRVVIRDLFPRTWR